MVDGSRACGRQRFVAEIRGKAIWIVWVHANDMNRAEVVFVVAFVEPGAGKVEGRAVPLLKAEHSLIEAAGFLGSWVRIE